jgi:hypothetical protein
MLDTYFSCIGGFLSEEKHGFEAVDQKVTLDIEDFSSVNQGSDRGRGEV